MKKGKYRHYKGNFYEVIGTATNSETLEEMVIYKALYQEENSKEEKVWVRPKKMFLEKINLNGKQVQRFEFIE